MPPGVDCTVLPSLYKDRDGQYRSRRLRMSLDEIIALRRKILFSAISAFEPDIFIVDGVPWGVARELDSTLEYLRDSATCHCVLGMRDIWDEPGAIATEWRSRGNWDAIRRYYEQVWIYGDPAVYDATHEYDLEEDIGRKVTYTGYLHAGSRIELLSYNNNVDPLPFRRANTRMVLCSTGGGQDGYRLGEAFIGARIPIGTTGILLTGPQMEPEARKRLHLEAENKTNVRVIDFVSEPTALLQHADCVISMGGYNTICEIMSFGKRALVIPRVVPRLEQLMRAERLQSLGILEVLHPDKLEPKAITRFVQLNLGKGPPKIQVDMDGLTRVLNLVESLLASRNFPRSASLARGAS